MTRDELVHQQVVNLQSIRFNRPWVDAEFSLYQKLLAYQEALLDAYHDVLKLERLQVRRKLNELKRQA